MNVKGLRNKLKSNLGQYYRIFGPLFRLTTSDRKRKLIFDKDTDIVIEGFPRSANTFAVVFFEQAQKKDLKIAHHLHVECQLIYAAKKSIPAIVLIREPVNAIQSLLKRYPETKPKNALKRYIKFYSNLMRYRDHFVIANFSEVTVNMSKVIDGLNTKHGTNFNIGFHDQVTEKKVFDRIELINNNIDEGLESHVARPSKYREAMPTKINLDEYQNEVEKANNVYKQFIQN